MRLSSCTVCLFILGIVAGCCGQGKAPVRPLDVPGWERRTEETRTFDGTFVLNKGESTDNGRIGIEVVDIIPARCDCFGERGLPVAMLRFYRVSDGTVICEQTGPAGVGLLNHTAMCGSDFEWSFLNVDAINAKDNWVAFRLQRGID